MTTFSKIAAVACVLSCSVSTPVLAQASSSEEEIAALRAELARLASRLEQLEGELAKTNQTANEAASAAASAVDVAAAAQTSAQQPAADIAFKGAPSISTESGWSFKPRGRANLDFGFVNAPSSTGADSGFDAEARRIRLGVSGDIPGGFGYKIEADFAENEVALTDAIITYEDDGLTLTAGQHNNFQSMEELTSSLNTSFIERAAFTDAFGFERRLGFSGTYKTDILLLQAGIFADNSEDLPNGNTSVDARVVVAPKLGDTQLHFGSSIHFNDLGSNNSVRYRQRPLVHFTDNRFINTGNMSATSELGVGFEAAAISGPFHVALEAYSQNVNRPGALADPSFFGGSAEIGLFLTEGDSRGYKLGTFDRVKPESPVGEGGKGALQVNLRYDYLDLNSGAIIGGTQDSVQASLIWTLTDYTRLLFNYGLLSYDDAAFSTAAGDTSYDVHVAGIRAQVDF